MRNAAVFCRQVFDFAVLRQQNKAAYAISYLAWWMGCRIANFLVMPGERIFRRLTAFCIIAQRSHNPGKGRH
jgi:hypothetical protein